MREKLLILVCISAIFGGASAQVQTTSSPPSKEILLENQRTVNNDRTTWDIDLQFNSELPFQFGIETDGNHFYSNSGISPIIEKFDMEGNYLGSFTTAMVSFKDMAYDGSYFYASNASMTLYKLDFVNQTQVSTIDVTCTGVTGIRHIAFDPTLDDGNGGFWIGNYNELGAIDMEGNELLASTTTEIAFCQGSAFDPYTDPDNPCLWLFCQPDNAGAIFKQYDINTASLTGVTHDATTDPGYVNGKGSGACAYEKNGKYYLVGCIHQIPSVITSYEIAYAAPAGAPNMVTSLSAVAGDNGALTAELTWTNPDVTVNGETLTALTSVDVYINDESTAEYSNSTPVVGGDETTSITVDENGLYTFKVVATNSEGQGIAELKTLFVGHDVPVAPSNVVLEATDMNATLTWDAPTEGKEGGYIDPSTITYDVVRYPGDELVADDITANTFTELLATANTYHYKVTASNPQGDSEASLSNELAIGDVLTFDFESGMPEGSSVFGNLPQWKIGEESGYDFDVPAHTNFLFINDNDLNGDNRNEWFVLPSFDFSTTSAPYIKFSHVHTMDSLTVRASIDNGLSWTDVEILVKQSNVTTLVWSDKTIDLTQFEGQSNVRIAFHYNDKASWGYGWAIDDIIVNGTLNTIDCALPSHININEDVNSIELSWTANSATQWNIEWGVEGFTLGEGTNVSDITTNPYSLSGLDAGINYDIYIQSSCGSDESMWVGPISFRAKYEPISSFPYFDGFEDGLDTWTVMTNSTDDGLNGENLIPSINWELNNPDNALYGSLIYEGVRSAIIDFEMPAYSWLISRDIVLDDNAKQLDFYMNYYNEFGEVTKLYVLIFDGDSWNVELTFDENSSSNDFDEVVTVDLSSYVNNTINVAFVYEYNDGYEVSIDNVSIDNQVSIDNENTILASVYPNPSNQYVMIENAKGAELTIYNALGQVVLSSDIDSNKEFVNSSNLSEGSYILKLKSESGSYTQKLNVIR